MIDPALAPFVWRPNEAAGAVRTLADGAKPTDAATAPEALASDPEDIAEVASDLGFAAELRDLGGQRPLRETLRQALAQGPLLVRVPEAAGGGWLAIRRLRGERAHLSGPAGPGRIALDVVEDALWAGMDADATVALGPTREALAALFADGRRATRAARALLGPRLAQRVLTVAWELRAPAPALRQDLARVHAGPRAAAIAAAYLAQMFVFVGIWRFVGRHALAHAAIGGRALAQLFGLLAGWAALQLAASTALRRLALDAGATIRAWLLRGAVNLDPEQLRDAGVGQLLGRALDAEALDRLALGGGVEALAGSFELAFGAVVLSMGWAPAAALGALALALGSFAATVAAQARRHAAWSERRRALTHDLVERMVGHRTLLVQDDPARRAAEDDRALEGYDACTRRLDRVATWIEVGLPRLFLLLALAAVAGSLAWKGAAAPAELTAKVATALGGAWLAYAGLRRLGMAAGDLIAVRDAWARVRPLIAPRHAPESASRAAAGAVAGAPVLAARALEYRYPRRPQPQLAGASLTVGAGDRLLIAGPSGAGKSTLAALLTGLKRPSAGELLLHGRQQETVGLTRWRRAVGAVPQFHENHVFGADLLFNLLLGRRWPPRPDDVALAEAICRELGLGPLLARMPAGLQQTVGETGWQLSHGERSRLFVARSLLQVLDARVLDESFAALDPQTLDEVMEAVLRRPEPLLVIAHP